jgi:hypothetical protein
MTARDHLPSCEAPGYEMVEQTKAWNYLPISFLKQHVMNPGSLDQIIFGLKIGNVLIIATPKRAN